MDPALPRNPERDVAAKKKGRIRKRFRFILCGGASSPAAVSDVKDPRGPPLMSSSPDVGHRCSDSESVDWPLHRRYLTVWRIEHGCYWVAVLQYSQSEAETMGIMILVNWSR